MNGAQTVLKWMADFDAIQMNNALLMVANFAIMILIVMEWHGLRITLKQN